MAETKLALRPQKIKVIHIRYDNIQQFTNPVRKVAVPPFTWEHDSSALRQAWRKMAALKAAGKLKPVPPAPTSVPRKKRVKQAA
jgi:hypothetical protein